MPRGGLGLRVFLNRVPVLLCAAAMLASATWSPAMATSMSDEIAALVENHSRIKAAEADVVSAFEEAEAALGDWFPNLSLSTSFAYENQIKGNDTKDTSLPGRRARAALSQLLWDFGATNAGIERARIGFRQAEFSLVTTRQTLILDCN